MIYLIGGAPRVGKSTIAKKFAESIKGRFISTDDLEDLDNKLPLIIFHNDHKKNTLTPSKRLESIKNEAEQIISCIDKIIDKAANQSQDIIIEGVHLFPVDVDKLIKKYGNDKIKVIIIGSRNVELILEGLEKNTSPNNWLNDFNQKVLRQIALFTKDFSEYLINESEKYNLPYRERTKDFKKDISKIINEFN